ncbi:MAG: hypothetical protein V7638_3816 [Acidobacteriota bacterium]|jgi:TP901 family phage tail tape measure protein
MATEIASLVVSAGYEGADAEKGLDRLNEKHEKTVAGLKSGQGQVASYTQKLLAWANANNQAATTMSLLGNNTRQTTNAVNQNSNAVTQGTRATNQNTQAVNANRNAQTQAASALQRHRAAVDNLRGSLEGMARDAQRAGAAITAGVTLPLAGASAAAAKFAGDLESKVSLIRTIRPDFDASQVFDKLSLLQTRIPQTSEQLGEASYNIVSSLDDIGQAATLNLTEKFGKGATAARVEALEFGTAILGVMNAYGMKATEVDHIQDRFFQTVNRGIITGGELSRELAGVSKAAQNAGVDFDTLMALVVGATKEAGPAAENMTQLSQVLNQFTGKEAQKGLKELGIETHNARGEFLPFIQILDEVKKKYDTLSEVDKSKLVQGLFPDIRSQKGFATLLRQLPTVQSAKEDPGVSGAADRAFETVNKTFNFQFEIFKNTARHALETLGAELLPILVPVVKALSEFLVSAIQTATNAWKQMPGGVKAGIVALLGFVASLGPVLVIVGTVASAILGLAGSIASLVTAAGAVGGFVALSEILIPVGAVIAAITIYIVELAAVATATATAVYTIWKTNWLGVRDLTLSAWNAIKRFLLQVWNELRDAYGLIMPQLKTLTANVLGLIEALWNSHGKAVVIAVKGAWEIITTVIRTALRVISSVITAVLAMINGDWQTVWDMAIRIVDAFLAGFVTILLKAQQALTTLIAFLVAKAIEFQRAGLIWGAKLIVGLVTGIKGGAIEAVAAAVGIAIMLMSPSVLAAYAAAGVAQARARNQAYEANQNIQQTNQNPQRYNDEGEYVSGAPGYSDQSEKATATNSTRTSLPAGFGEGSKKSGQNAAAQKFKVEMQIAEVAVQTIERLNQKLLADADYYYSEGIQQLEQYVTAKRKASDDLFKAENERNNQEAFALAASGLRGRQRDLAEAQLSEKVKATWQKHSVAVTEIERFQSSERLSIQRSFQQATVTLAQEAASGTEAIWNRLAEQGVVSFGAAQKRIAQMQLEILQMQEQALVGEQSRLTPDTKQFNDVLAQLQEIRQRMANLLRQSGADADEANKREYERLQQHRDRLRGIYDSIADMTAETERDRLRLLEQMGVRKEVVWKKQAELEIAIERMATQRRTDDLRRQREYVEKFEKNEQRRAEIIAGINDQIEAEETRSAQRRQDIIADYYEKQRERLREAADKIVSTFKNALDKYKEEGWKGFFKSLGDSFRDTLEQMALDLVKSRVLSLLQTVFKIPQASGAGASGSQPSDAGNSGKGIFNSILSAFGLGRFGGVDDQATKTSTPIVSAVDRSTTQIVTAVRQAGALSNHATGSGGGTQNLVSSLLGTFTNNSPFAITEAGHEAVHAIDAAGESNAGAVDRTGKSTSSAIITAGQGMVGVMTQMLSIMANFGATGGFTWKGLFASMAIGALNGAIGGLTGGGSGSQGGIGSAAGKALSGLANGGMISGPGTTTSDSILGVDPNGVPTARVSRGEFIVNARATAKQRSALEYINATGELPGFSWGGFFKALSPVYAAVKSEKVRAIVSPAASMLGFGGQRGNKGLSWLFPVSNLFARANGGIIDSPSFAAPASRSSFSPSGGPVENHFHFSMPIYARDAADVKRSEGQIKRKMHDSLRQVAFRLA